MKKTLSLTLGLAALTLAATNLRASSFQFSNPPVSPSAVTPLDTFVLSVAGFDSAGTNGVYLIQPITATFNGTGAAQTFAGTGAGGAQTVTVTTTETIGATNTTDTVTIGVPANFIPSGTTTSAGTAIQLIEFDLGAYTAGTNTLDFLTAVASPTYTGFAKYGTNGASTINFTSANLIANTVFSNNNMSLGTAESINTTNTAGLSQFAIRTFSYSVTYANAVPEPSTLALGVLGLVGGVAGIVRRRTRAKN